MVKHVRTAEEFFGRAFPEPNSGCWLWSGWLTSRGYGRMQVSGVQTHAHRVSWQLHRGQIPDGLFVLHKCDTPCCVNPDHLFLGTHDANMADKAAKGRQFRPRGDRHGMAKLKPEQIAEIRTARGTKAAIARRYGVSRATVRRIVQHRAWAHI